MSVVPLSAAVRACLHSSLAFWAFSALRLVMEDTSSSEELVSSMEEACLAGALRQGLAGIRNLVGGGVDPGCTCLRVPTSRVKALRTTRVALTVTSTTPNAAKTTLVALNQKTRCRMLLKLEVVSAVRSLATAEQNSRPDRRHH